MGWVTFPLVLFFGRNSGFSWTARLPTKFLEATVNHIFDHLKQGRKEILSALETESERLRRLVPELRETILASTDLMRVTGDSAAAIDRIVARFEQIPPVMKNEEYSIRPR